VIGRTDIGVGTPTHEGIYAVEVFCGWKLLDWSVKQGWHIRGTCKWNADVPTQWVGPLPPRKYEGRKGAETPPEVFDL